MDRRTVLLIHPDRARLERLGKALPAEFDALSATSPDAAWQLLSLHAVDAVVLDAQRSVDLLDELEIRAPSAKRVLLVNGQSAEDVIQAMGEGHDFIALPEADETTALRRQLQALLFPRTSERYFPSEHLVLRFSLAGRWDIRERRVLDISSRGLAFLVDVGEPLEHLLPGSRLMELSVLRTGEEVLSGLSAVVRRLEPLFAGNGVESRPGPHANLSHHTGFKVGIEFLAAPHGIEPEPTQEIRDGIRRQALLREAVRRCKLKLRSEDEPSVVLSVSAGEVDSTAGTLSLVCEGQMALTPGEVVRATMDLGGSSYVFFSSVLACEPETSKVLLRAPRRLRTIHRRRSSRSRVSKHRQLEVELSPLTGPPAIRRTLLNLNTSGLAFTAKPDDVLPVGTVFPDLRVHLPDGNMIAVRGRVVSLVPLGNRNAEGRIALRCGVGFEEVSPEGQALITEALLAVRHPGLQAARALSFEHLWKFLKDTGFLYPEKLEKLRPVMPEIERTLSLLLQRPDPAFKTLLFSSGGAVQGHISAVRVYRRTWMMQHLAAQHESQGWLWAARTLVLGIAEYVEQHPDIEWIKVFFRPNNRWPARVFGRFARRSLHPELCDLRTYSYLVAPTADAMVPQTDSDVELRSFFPDDSAQIESYFAAAGRHIALRADDLCRDALDLSEVAGAFRHMGLERRREVLVATRRGRMVGFALLEVSSIGINFSELTSAFTVHVFDPRDATTVAMLAARARVRYRELGRPHAVCLVETGDLTPYEAAGFHKQKEYSCITMHRSLYGRYYEHVSRLYERFEARRFTGGGGVRL